MRFACKAPVEIPLTVHSLGKIQFPKRMVYSFSEPNKSIMNTKIYIKLYITSKYMHRSSTLLIFSIDTHRPAQWCPSKCLTSLQTMGFLPSVQQTRADTVGSLCNIYTSRTPVLLGYQSWYQTQILSSLSQTASSIHLTAQGL